MNNKAAKALEVEIKTWRRNLKAAKSGRNADVDIKQSSSALCAAFHHDEIGCRGCPVFERTGQHSCEGTPYQRVEDLLEEIPRGEVNEGLITAVQAELDFLISLREEAK